MAKIKTIFACTTVFAIVTLLVFINFTTKTLSFDIINVARILTLAKYRKHQIYYEISINSTDFNEKTFDQILQTDCNPRSINNTDECLTEAEKYDLNKLDINFNDTSHLIYFHTFWQPRNVKPHHLRVMNLNILSYLATQDLQRTKLIVWSLTDITKEIHITDQYKKYLNLNLEFKIVNFKELCKKGVFATKYKFCESMKIEDFVKLSDFLRFLILYNFGGIYIDGDVILLRDMKPFWTRNFVYRWSAELDYNTAAMGFRYEHGEKIERLYTTVVSRVLSIYDFINGFYPNSFKNTVISMNNTDIYSYDGLEVIHSVLFDPAWLCQDLMRYSTVTKRRPLCLFPNFYDEKIKKEDFDFKNFFPGAFAYHLHLNNCGSCNITTESYFYHIEEYFKSKLL